MFDMSARANHLPGKIYSIIGKHANGEEFPIESAISNIQMDEEKIYTAILPAMLASESKPKTKLLTGKNCLRRCSNWGKISLPLPIWICVCVRFTTVSGWI